METTAKREVLCHQKTPAEYISVSLVRAENLRKGGNIERADAILEALEGFMRKHAPRGSGFDSGTKLSAKTKPQRLVLDTSFHHMDENGFYDGWTEHEVIVTPEFGGQIEVRVTGRDRNDIKSYIGEMFHYWLTTAMSVPCLIEQGDF